MTLRVNRAKQALREGRVAIGTMLTQFRSSAVPVLLAKAGMDFVIIDNEHSAFTFETNQDIARNAKPYGLAVIVRVTEPEYHLVARTLDAGADGVMVPRVEKRGTVETIVESVKYPPVGRRGYGLGPIHTEYDPVAVSAAIQHFNENTLIIVQIESVKAVESLEELVSVQGVDVALVGPVDLSISLGIPGQLDHPRMKEAYQRVLEAGHKHGVHLGVHLPDIDSVAYWRDQGARLLTYSTEERMLYSAAADAVARLRV